MTTLANLRVKFGADTSEFKRATASMSQGLGSLGRTAFAVAGSLGLGALVTSAISSAGALADLQAKTGLSAEFLSGMRYKATLAGKSIDDVARASLKLSRSAEQAAQGSKAMADVFALAKINVDEFVKLTPDEQIKTFSDALAALNSRSQRTYVLTKLMGAGAAGLAPLFEEGRAGLARFHEEARAANQVLSQDQVDAGDAAGDALDALQMQYKGLADQLVLKYVPALTAAITKMREMSSVAKGLPDEARFTLRGFQTAGNLIGGYAAVTMSGLPYDQAAAMLAEVRADSDRILQDDISAKAARRGEPNEAERRTVELLARINDSQKEMTGVLRRQGMAVAQ